MTVYELFDGSGPGAYYFHAPNAGGWVVCDLDTGRCSRVERLVRFDLRGDYTALGEKLERPNSPVVAMVGRRGLTRFDALITMWRDYAEDLDPDTLVLHEKDGSVCLGAPLLTVLNQLADGLKSIRKRTRDTQ